MEVADFQADVLQIIGEILGGTLGECGDQDALPDLDPAAAKFDRLVDLSLQRANHDAGIE